MQSPVSAATIISSLFVISIILNLKISYFIANEFQSKALSTLLDKGFTAVSQHNNAELLDLMTNQINLVGVCINYFLLFISGCSTTFVFTVALMLFDAKSTVILAVVVFFFYFLANFFVKPIVKSNSKKKLTLSLARATYIENIKSLYRELFIENILYSQTSRLSSIDLEIRKLQFRDQALGVFPKYLIEGVAIVSLLTLDLLMLILAHPLFLH